MYVGIVVHKQYSRLDTIFNNIFHFGPPGQYLQTSRETRLSVAGFAGRRIVIFWDLSIDVFLESKMKNIVRYCV